MLKYIFTKNKVNKQLIFNLGFKHSLDRLLSMNYLIEEKEEIKLNPDYLFSSIKNMHTEKRLQYKTISYDIKREPKLSKEEALAMLKPLMDIEECKECYIINYIPGEG